MSSNDRDRKCKKKNFENLFIVTLKQPKLSHFYHLDLVDSLLRTQNGGLEGDCYNES